MMQMNVAVDDETDISRWSSLLLLLLVSVLLFVVARIEYERTWSFSIRLAGSDDRWTRPMTIT